MTAALLVASPAASDPEAKGLLAARAGFRTQPAPFPFHADGPLEAPPPGPFQIVRYRSPAGDLAAYVTRDPGDGKHPAVLWAHPGYGTVDVEDLVEVEPLALAGLVVMCPSWRGEADNHGRFEAFYGEVDDALAALDHLSRLPYVDPARVYVAGHGPGGTIALLVAEASARPRAVFSFGGMLDMAHDIARGGGSAAPHAFPIDNPREVDLRSPIRFVSDIQTRTYYFEGLRSSADRADAKVMADIARTASVPFSAQIIEGGDHSSILKPLLELIAKKVVADDLAIAPEEARAAFAASRPPVVLREARSELEMTLATSGADVCKLIPKGDKNPEECAGIDAAAGRASMEKGGRTVAAAVVRFDGWNVTVLVERLPGSFSLATEKSRDDFARDLQVETRKMGSGARLHGEAPGSYYTLATVAGRPAMKTIAELDAADGSREAHVDRTVTYFVPTDDAAILVAFTTDHAHLGELQRFAEASIATLKVRPARAARGPDLGPQVDGALDGLTSFFIMSGVVVALALQRAYVHLSRKRSRP
jgi:dienelactone hydrolase